MYLLQRFVQVVIMVRVRSHALLSNFKLQKRALKIEGFIDDKGSVRVTVVHFFAVAISQSGTTY